MNQVTTNSSATVNDMGTGGEKKKYFSPDVYSDKDKEYWAELMKKLETARQQRNETRLEFGNQTYLERFNSNKAMANSIMSRKQKMNKEEVEYTSGTLEHKLEAVLSSVNALNLTPKVRAYDKRNMRVMQIGTAMEDVIFQTAELENDEEKRLARQKELMVQGEVFVEEMWSEKLKTKKKFAGVFSGQFSGIEWTEKKEKYFEGPERRVVYGPNMYLGDISVFDIKDQPYLFEVRIEPYEKVKSIFGKWEMWQYVQKQKVQVASDAEVEAQWNLNNDVSKDECEVIIYQDKWNDEYNVVINGVMMLPSRFPLSQVTPNGEYSYTKQVYRIVDSHFAYGRGFIQSAEKAHRLLDEMLRLSILKTRRSFMPPWVNTTKRYISPRILEAGKVTMGIPEDALKPLGELSDGVTASEFQMMSKLQDNIDKLTVSPQFTGQQGKAGTTATEVLELRKQAEMTLGLTIFACAALEKKLGYLRLWNLLEHWFEPIDYDVINESKINRYRNISRETAIPNEGKGERELILVDGEIPKPEEIRALENEESTDKGFPVQKIFLRPKDMKNAIKSWYIVVQPQEKDSSDLQKVMFREELVDLTTMANMGAVVEPAAVQEEYGRVYQRDASKMFKKPQVAPPTSGTDPNSGQGAGVPNVAGLPSNNNIVVQ